MNLTPETNFTSANVNVLLGSIYHTLVSHSFWFLVYVLVVAVCFYCS